MNTQKIKPREVYVIRSSLEAIHIFICLIRVVFLWTEKCTFVSVFLYMYFQASWWEKSFLANNICIYFKVRLVIAETGKQSNEEIPKRGDIIKQLFKHSETSFSF